MTVPHWEWYSASGDEHGLQTLGSLEGLEDEHENLTEDKVGDSYQAIYG